jgi:hypothetical protein
MWHDLGLALIYGAVLEAWMFPIVYAILVLWEGSPHWFFNLPAPQSALSLSKDAVAGLLAAFSAAVFVTEFLLLERRRTR